jgi:hypothetical protein
LSKMFPAGWLSLIAAALFVQAPRAGAQTSGEDSGSKRQGVSLGAYYSRGDYGQAAATSIYYYPVSYDLSLNNWRFKASVPHIEISGLGNVLVNIGGMSRGRLESDFRTDEYVSAKGVGDTTISAGYQFAPVLNGELFFDLTAEIKIPTADEYKGLGTGQPDYAMQLDLYHMVGKSTLFSTIGYRRREQSRLFEDLQNTLFFSLGGSRPLPAWLENHVGGRWTYGLIYDYREAASLYSTETHELMPYLSWSPAPSWTIMAYAVTGFTRDSADTAAGAQLSYHW